MGTQEMAKAVVARFKSAEVACERGANFHSDVTGLERAARLLGAALASASRLALKRSPGANMAAKTVLENALPEVYMAATSLDRSVGNDPELKRVLDGVIKAVHAAGENLESAIPGSDIAVGRGLAAAANAALMKALGVFHEACSKG